MERERWWRWLLLGIHTLMGDLEDGPETLVLLLALVTRVLGVFELVLEFKEGVFDARACQFAPSSINSGERTPQSLPEGAADSCWF